MAILRCACGREFTALNKRAKRCYFCRGAWREEKYQRNLGERKDRAAIFYLVEAKDQLGLEVVRVRGNSWLVEGAGVRKPVWVGMEPVAETCQVQLRWEAFNKTRVVGAKPRCVKDGWLPWMYDHKERCACGFLCDPYRLARYINEFRQEERDRLRGGKKPSSLNQEEMDELDQGALPSSGGP